MSISHDPPTKSGRLRILLVDDDDLDRLAVRRCLQQSGVAVEVDEATSVVETLERIGSTVYECVLLDYYLPGLDGVTLLKRIRDIAPHLPVVMFTGRGDEEIAVELMKAGAVDYLPKASLTPERMASCLRHATELAAAAAAWRRAEEERAMLLELERAARAQAVAALEARDAFFASVTHDLRTPLAGVKGFAQVLKRRLARTDPPAPDWLIDGLAQIESSANRTVMLVDEILDLARYRDTGRLELRLEPFDLVALCQTVVAEQQRASDRHQLNLTTPLGELVGVWDRGRMERVIGNLIGNAVKYSPHGGPVLIKLGCEAGGAGEEAVVSVQDQGLGIPADEVPRIFDRFWRAGNVEGRIGGTGVGLASVRQIVEAHGGTVAVDSQEGVGSIFTVRIPLHAPVVTPAGDDQNG